MSKFIIEACLQMKYEFGVQRREGHILTYHVLKRPRVKKNTFDIPTFKFKKGLEQKISIFLASLRQPSLWEPYPPKKMFRF